MAVNILPRAVHGLSSSPPRRVSQVARSAPLRRSSFPGIAGSDHRCDCGRLVAAHSVERQAEVAGMSYPDGSSFQDSSSKLVLVVGGTGGVGQLVVASLLRRKIKARLLLRNLEKAAALFGEQDDAVFEVRKADTRNTDELDSSMFEGVTHVICCTGTTAFPSKRWEDDNTPEHVDWLGIRNLIAAVPRTVRRFVLVSSVGVTKYNELPWSIMNLFGVLKFKKMGEDCLHDSGIPFTIIRAGRLTDGPYTSYDLNTLLQATAGERRAVVISQGDKLVGEVSRLVVAEACIQALDIDFTEREVYEINSVKGDGPGSDPEKWRELFMAAAATPPCK